MVKLEVLTGYLDALLNISDVTDDFKNGLIFKGKDEVGTVGLATHTTFEVIDNAKKERVDFLLVHHGGWEEIDMSLFGQKMSKLDRYRISLYIAHSSLDNASEFGTGDSLARLLEMSIIGRFADYGKGKAGVYGTVDKTSFDMMCQQLLRKLPGAKIEASKNGAEYVTKLAIVTGNGKLTKWLEEAYKLGCDTYLTGEGSVFTRIFAKEIAMNLIFAGHTSTERPGVLSLGRKIKEKFKDIKIIELKETFF